jgi:TPP-dependent 2-oxoacid decarboxylase
MSDNVRSTNLHSTLLCDLCSAAWMQLFAANIGWAAPAGLGFALGTDRRMLVMGGDGGLQMTSGAIGDYVKCGSNAIWVCINNDGCECLVAPRCARPCPRQH